MFTYRKPYSISIMKSVELGLSKGGYNEYEYENEHTYKTFNSLDYS